MLSRIAESLFWIGRYSERADATSRLLQVHMRLLIEDPYVTESASCRNVLALMGIEDLESPTGDDLLQILGYDEKQPTSIVSCWRAARDNARRAREVIPSELWECINTTWHQLPSGRFRPGRHDHFFSWARERSALFAGIARGTMVRDEGWQYLVLGRSLEQADMSSRLVASAALSSGPTPWPAVLRGCGAHDAFLRTYRGFHADREAAEFLILDRGFPRSIMHGLKVATESLDALTPKGSEQHGGTEALYLLGKLRANLEYTPMTEQIDNLSEQMAEVQAVCDAVTKIISATFFAVQAPTSWAEGATV